MKTNQEYVEEFIKFIEPALDKGFDDGYRGAELEKAQKAYRDRYAWAMDMKDWLRTTLEAKDKECEERVEKAVGESYRAGQSDLIHELEGAFPEEPLEFMDEVIMEAHTTSERLQAITPTKTDKQKRQ